MTLALDNPVASRFPANEGPSNLTVVGAVAEDCPDFDIADERVVETLFATQRRHFWFGSRNHLISMMMKRVGLCPPMRVLDIGCGTGTVLAHLLACGYRGDGLEMHHRLAAQAAVNCPGANVLCADVMGASPIHAAYDAVGLFDVLEHVTEPASLLARCAGLVRPGGTVVGTVPALQSLWSALDIAAGHRRRYDRAALAGDLTSAGLEILRLDYFFQVLLAPMWIQRRSIRAAQTGAETDRSAVVQHGLKVPPRAINAMFRMACFAERKLARFLPLGWIPGASLFFAVRRSR